MPIIFRRCLNIEQGDLFCDVCLTLADNLREDPQRIALKIINTLPSESSSKITSVSGYINLTTENLPSNFSQESFLRSLTPLKIIVPPIGGLNGNSWGYSRLVASALTQVALCEHFNFSAELALDEFTITTSSKTDLKDTFIKSVTLSSKMKDPSEWIFEQLDSTSSAVTTIVWLSPYTFTRKFFNTLMQHYKDNDLSIIWRIPSSEWFDGIDAPDIGAYINQLEESSISSLITHLANNRLGCDLDPYVCEMSESDNFLWQHQFSTRRLEKLVPTHIELSKDTLVDLKTVGLSLELAAAKGEISHALAQLERSLRQINHALNQRRTDATGEEGSFPLMMSALERMLAVRVK